MIPWYWTLICLALGYVAGGMFGFPKISFGRKDE